MLILNLMLLFSEVTQHCLDLGDACACKSSSAPTCGAHGSLGLVVGCREPPNPDLMSTMALHLKPWASADCRPQGVAADCHQRWRCTPISCLPTDGARRSRDVMLPPCSMCCGPGPASGPSWANVAHSLPFQLLLPCSTVLDHGLEVPTSGCAAHRLCTSAAGWHQHQIVCQSHGSPNP